MWRIVSSFGTLSDVVAFNSVTVLYYLEGVKHWDDKLSNCFDCPNNLFIHNCQGRLKCSDNILYPVDLAKLGILTK